MRLWRLAVILLAASFAKLASAHEVGLSRGSYRLEGSELKVELWFSSAELSLAAGEKLAARVRATEPASEVDCARGSSTTEAVEPLGIRVLESFHCPAGSERVRLSIDFFDDLSRGHRHLAKTQGGSQAREAVLSESQRTLELVAASSPAPRPRTFAVPEFGRLGLEHILTGYDHLLFLLGLVLVRSRLAELVKTISAFTLAHSLTLGCAALGWWVPPSRAVEPAIALSIAFVGWENLRTSQPARRWLVTFGFGLVHGFGFAGALLEAKLPPKAVPMALVGFNLGVEVGQLLVAGALAGLLAGVRSLRRREVARWAELALNGGVFAAGVVWLALRLRQGFGS